MKKVRKMSIIVAIALLVAVICSIVASQGYNAGDKTAHWVKDNNIKGHEWFNWVTYDDANRVNATIDESTRKINICAYCMGTYYNNMYCVQHAYRLDQPLMHDDTTLTFDAIAKAEITGNTVVFTNYQGGEDGKTKVTSGKITSDINNKLAAIFNEKTEFEYGYVTSGRVNYGVQRESYTYAQLAVYYLWDNWVENTGAANYGFESSAGGNTISKKDDLGPFTNIDECWNRAQAIDEKINNISTSKEYKATIWFIKYGEGTFTYTDYGDDGTGTTKVTASIQKLIIADPNGVVEEKKIDIPVKKIWNDNNNANGDRPTSITVELYKKTANTAETFTGKTLTLSGASTSNSWSAFFEPLPLTDENGDEITYSIKEISVPGYTSKISGSMYSPGFTITNTPEQTDISVTKAWEDRDNKYNFRPDSITVTLYKNGVATNQTVTLNESNNWKAKFTNLYKYENGNEITYTVKEESVPVGYKSITTGDMTSGYTITNTHEVYDGYIEITGKVWLDKLGGKANELNGKLDDDESGLEGIKVVLKDSNGNQFDATSTATTDSDGIYTIKVNYDNSQNVYKLYEDVTAVAEKLKTAYVEFEYNAMKYTTVAVAGNGNTEGNTSKAIENVDIRNSFDAKYQKVTSQTDISTIEAETITANTKNVIDFTTYSAKANYVKGVTIKACDGNGNYLQTNSQGAWLNITYGRCNSTNHPEECSGEVHSLREYGVEVIRIQNVNLGLFEREQPDVAIFSDLDRVEVVMSSGNGTSTLNTFKYGARDTKLEAEGGLQVKFQNKETYTYKRPIHPTDIAAIQDSSNGMSVKVTYKVKVGNLSTTLPVIVHNITNYYDSRYTLNTSGWTVNNANGYNIATFNGDLNLVVQPGMESDAIELTYTVSQEAIKGLLSENATLNNAVEIQSYSTIYGENTLYAEQSTGARTNNAYGGYDYDSHPGNAGIYINEEGILAAANIEDDTDMAASFVLHKDENYYRVLSGNVWEDSDTNADDGYRLGDGKKSTSERNVKDVKVELYINVNGTFERAKLYKIDENSTEVNVVSKDAVVYTDENGHYSFGDKEYGIPMGEYIIKFTYGKGIDDSKSSSINGVEISARDYKSTIISPSSSVYEVFKETNTSKDWYLNMTKGYSIAVDDMQERLNIPDLKYSNFDNSINLSASSKPFIVSMEFEQDVFDFGIIERAREDIFVETTIDYLKITLANGQVLTEGNPKDTMNYAKSVGFKQNIESGFDARKALEKQVAIEMDTELIQGAELQIKYQIKVTNNGEKDIDYTKGTEFYYFGTNTEGSPEITESVNKVVTYMDAGMTYKWEDPTQWTQVVSADTLRVENDELISENTYKEISDNEYIIYTTDTAKNLQPGQTNTYTVTASKVLANATEENDNVYEIHAEILEINAKTARTMSQTGGTKEYKMGNYVPSLKLRNKNDDISKEQAGLHEQDDDRVKIIITPPTGDANYIITYVIAGLAGLIVIAIAVMFIKKKVLTK